MGVSSSNTYSTGANYGNYSRADGQKYTTKDYSAGGSQLVTYTPKKSGIDGENEGQNGGSSGYSYSGGGGGGSDDSGSSAVDWSAAIDSASSGSSTDTILNSSAGDATKKLLDDAGLTEEVDVGKVDNINIDEEKALLAQLKEAQEKQAIESANNTVETGIKEAQRTQADAQEEYQTQRNQIDIDEQRALDNQVLYAEARGDRGGIGQAQYNDIQNTAATNRLTVQKEQTKLATDTARQIADLRAQGEFEKADALLTISQNYLSQLMSLEQWAKETNVSIDEFNIQVDEWKNNFKVSLLDAQINAANATGAFSDGTPTYTAYSSRQSQLASIGNTLIQAGIDPTTEMLNAMGMNKTQAVSYLNKYYPAG